MSLAGAVAPSEPSLRDPAHRVSRRAVSYWTVRALPGWALLLLGQVVTAPRLDRAGHGGVVVTLLAVTTAMALAHVVVMPRWRYRVHRWEATPTAIYTQSGWLSQERRIAPVSRVQTVDTERGPLQQLFGLANVTVTTASAAGAIRIEGLDHQIARRLADELTVVTARTPDDAT